MTQKFSFHILLGLFIVLCIFILDQASKYWVLHGLNLAVRGDIPIFTGLDFTLIWNTGITFGLLQNFGSHIPSIIEIIEVIICIFLGIWLIKTKEIIFTSASSLMIGGALGNIVTRIIYGAQIDFIRLHVFGWSWYVFNIADSAIVCGAVIIIFLHSKS